MEAASKRPQKRPVRLARADTRSRPCGVFGWFIGGLKLPAAVSAGGSLGGGVITGPPFRVEKRRFGYILNFRAVAAPSRAGYHAGSPTRSCSDPRVIAPRGCE